jgi:2-iminobutanoate/2-iminopropanoate deaminase
MDKQVIETTNAPAAVGPYSPAIKTGNFIFLSGQVGLDPKTKKIVDGGVEAQAKQIFKNIKAVLAEAGAALQNYAQHFDPPFPARSAVAVRELPLDVDIEIEVIAVL